MFFIKQLKFYVYFELINQNKYKILYNVCIYYKRIYFFYLIKDYLCFNLCVVVVSIVKLKWFFVIDIDLFEYMFDRYVSLVLLDDLLFVKLYL